MFQEIIECLNTIKIYSGRIFMKFERNAGIVLKCYFINVPVGFSQNFGYLYYEPLMWFTIQLRTSYAAMYVYTYVAKCLQFVIMMLQLYVSTVYILKCSKPYITTSFPINLCITHTCKYVPTQSR